MAANVSVSPMNIVRKGKHKVLLQLGTVMTEESFRSRGLIRRLMQEIEHDYEGQVDGMYLFANDRVLDFYPKFGYRSVDEYLHEKYIHTVQPPSVVPAPMHGPEAWKKLEEKILKKVCNSSFGVEQNMSLLMFYVTKFMQDNVYYVPDQDSYVIAEREGNILLLHEVISEKLVDLDRIAAAFGVEDGKMILGFTPLEERGYTISRIREEDTTLFVKGPFFREWEAEKKRFPVLSHT